MRIGCNTLYGGGELGSTADFTPDELRRSLERNSALGYETVEFSHLCHLTLDEVTEIGAYTRRLGMAPWSVHAESASGFLLGRSPQEAAQSLVHAVQICQVVGAQVVVVHAPVLLGLTLGELPDVGALLAADLAVLRPGFDRARKCHVRLALENGGSLAHWVYILSLVERMAEPLLGVCVDTGHANLGDLLAPRAIRMAGSRLLTLHLHDNHGQADDHLPPGRGNIDWTAVMEALRDVRYSGPLQLELTDQAPHRAYDQALEQRQGIEYARGLSGAL
ncbi:MAG: sugar phosphate isomerase/epimerase [Chloroflexi bacterium]|nr:sugar phosphate isomerase/epimerase [Chloroflexota bacterium]